MNQELNSLSYEAIVDLLAQKTQLFTQLFSEKISGEEYNAYKMEIEELIQEIKSRQPVNITNTNIDFKQPDIT